ncbi:MAG: UbiA family prenyltransferase [Opitutales bacterium]|nr:UbiA family prenyltransferase [Opitutales bacterium]MBT5813788.1 UbiA family prenyltransferase [Opitutales bacterium]
MVKGRALLVLGRVSNLSTVWSNCLCAWILSGGGSNSVFASLLIGLSFLYVGGMYLNDYCDAGFDREYRPERPIPSGQIQQKTVLTLTLLFFVLGLAAISWTGIESAIYAVILIGLIVAYNLVHKKTTLGIPLMGACRTGVYLVVGAAGVGGLVAPIYWAGGLMFSYVIGITSLARTESNLEANSCAGLAMIAAPLVGAVCLANPEFDTAFTGGILMAVGWMLWALFRARVGGKLIVGKMIGPLLAGICLIDLAIIAAEDKFSLTVGGILLAFFVIALIAQRRIPAT